MFKDDGLDYENRPVKHGITREEHLQIRDAYFATKQRQAQNFDYQWALAMEVFAPR